MAKKLRGTPEGEFVPVEDEPAADASEAVMPEAKKPIPATQDKRLESPPENKAASPEWELENADSKTAVVDRWRVRVQHSGATGRWRPFIEWADDDFATEDGATAAAERLLTGKTT